jgi:hypothetical protein
VSRLGFAGIGPEGQLHIGGAVDADERLRGVAAAPLDVVRLEEVLSDRLDGNIAPARSGQPDIHGLVGLDFLCGQRTDKPVGLVELEAQRQVDFRLHSDRVLWARLVVGIDRSGRTDVRGWTERPEVGVEERIGGVETPPTRDGKLRRYLKTGSGAVDLVLILDGDVGVAARRRDGRSAEALRVVVLVPECGEVDI